VTNALDDKLARWDPRDDDWWSERLSRDQQLADRYQTSAMRRITAAVLQRSLADGGRAVALTGSTARAKRTLVSDLDYHIVGERPFAGDLPSDVDLYAGGVDHLEAKINAGDDFVQWTLRCGCLLADDGVLRAAAIRIVERALWPDGAAKLARLPEHRRLAERLIAVQDRDAAQDEIRATLTSAARGLLLLTRIFPLSRSELPQQLRDADFEFLAFPLEMSIYEEPSLKELTQALAVLESPELRSAA